MSSASSTYSTDASLESPAAWAHLVERLHRVANGQDAAPNAAQNASASDSHPRGRMPPPPTPGPAAAAAKKH